MENNLEKEKDIKNEVEREINELWETKLKENFIKELNSNFEKMMKGIQDHLDLNKKEIAKNIDQLVNVKKPEDIKSKMNEYCNNVIYENNTNVLVNLILICLSNIEPLVFFCLGNQKNEILKKIRDKENLFSLLIEFFNNVWLNNNNYNPIKIHNLLKLNKEKYDSKNPGDIINFILSKLNDELNFNKNINNNNNINRYVKEEVLISFKETIKSNKTKISDLFFVNYQIKKTCRQCDVETFYYEQKPIINLYIQQQIKNSFVLVGKLKDISLKHNFNFLLNDYIDVEEDCEFCPNKIKCKVNNAIKGFDNDILIINLNRGEDISPAFIRNVDFPPKITLELENAQFNYGIISILNRNTPLNDKEYNLYCKNFMNNKWYVYNKNNVKIENNEKEIFNGHKALLLIYKKLNN